MLCSYSSLEAETFWKLYRSESSEYIPPNLCNPKVHYSVRKRRVLIPILSQMKPVHIVTTIKLAQVAKFLALFGRCKVRTSTRVSIIPIDVFHSSPRSLLTNAAIPPLPSSSVGIGPGFVSQQGNEIFLFSTTSGAHPIS
jgi:hypothetical protein